MDTHAGEGFTADLLHGRVAVVTGAAGSIGGAVARAFAALGATVIGADHHATRLAELDRVPGVSTVLADLSTRDGVRSLVRAAAHAGTVDVLVNGVGEHLDSATEFGDGPDDEVEAVWQALYEVNVLSVLRMCHALVPGMRAAGWGRIVNFSSVEGIRAAPALAVYAGFKRAVDGFTKSLAVDLARHGVLVNAVAVDKTRAYQTGRYELPPEYERLVPTWIPAGHYADPMEVARLVVFLCSPLNSWVVGQSVVADGGTLSAGGWYRTPQRWTNQPLLVQYLEDESVNQTRPPSVR